MPAETTDARDRRLIDDYLSGMRGADICTKYGMCKQHMYQILRKHNVQNTKHGRAKRVLADNVRKIIELRDLGWYWPQIAKELGIHPNTLYDNLDTHAFPRTDVVKSDRVVRANRKARARAHAQKFREWQERRLGH
jgi:hypothetical protein